MGIYINLTLRHPVLWLYPIQLIGELASQHEVGADLKT